MWMIEDFPVKRNLQTFSSDELLFFFIRGHTFKMSKLKHTHKSQPLTFCQVEFLLLCPSVYVSLLLDG